MVWKTLTWCSVQMFPQPSSHKDTDLPLYRLPPAGAPFICLHVDEAQQALGPCRDDDRVLPERRLWVTQDPEVQASAWTTAPEARDAALSTQTSVSRVPGPARHLTRVWSSASCTLPSWAVLLAPEMSVLSVHTPRGLQLTSRREARSCANVRSPPPSCKGDLVLASPAPQLQRPLLFSPPPAPHSESRSFRLCTGPGRGVAHRAGTHCDAQVHLEPRSGPP